MRKPARTLQRQKQKQKKMKWNEMCPMCKIFLINSCVHRLKLKPHSSSSSSISSEGAGFRLDEKLDETNAKLTNQRIQWRRWVYWPCSMLLKILFHFFPSFSLPFHNENDAYPRFKNRRRHSWSFAAGHHMRSMKIPRFWTYLCDTRTRI